MAARDPMPRYDLNERPWYRMVSPGLSSVPAKSEPIITTLAPAASALVTSPEYLMPPSAMTGIWASRVARAHSAMAVIWGTPAPVTMRVVQMEPGPMPTLMASAPERTSSQAPSNVATLPARRSTSGSLALMALTAPITRLEWPWALSMASTSTLALTISWARSR